MNDTPETPIAKPKRPYHRKVTLTPRIREDKSMPEHHAPQRKTATIIYRRLEDTDPREQTFADIKFRADEPVEVPHSVTVQQLISEKYETSEGETRRRSREKLVSLADVLKGNPWFEVDGIQIERKLPHAKLPDDADGYRGYAINWISTSMSADSMDKRWAGEEGLRRRCGVSATELAYLRPFFESRRFECAELDRTRHVA